MINIFVVVITAIFPANCFYYQVYLPSVSHGGGAKYMCSNNNNNN